MCMRDRQTERDRERMNVLLLVYIGFNLAQAGSHHQYNQ